MKKVTPRDIMLAVLVIGFIIYMYGSMYFKGQLDDKLPNPIKKENLDKKLGEVKEVVGLEEKEVQKNINDNEAEDGQDSTIIILETSKGDIEIELFDKLMPVTTSNFKQLVEKKFYNGVRFHRIIKDFMIQSGDPNSKDLNKKAIWGQGGPGYAIEDEFVEDKKLTNDEYTIAMANAGPGTGGSQFFINTVNNDFLDFNKKPLTSKHPVFGRVVKGFDVVDKIENSENGGVIIKKAYIK